MAREHAVMGEQFQARCCLGLSASILTPLALVTWRRRARGRDGKILSVVCLEINVSKAVCWRHSKIVFFLFDRLPPTSTACKLAGQNRGRQQSVFAASSYRRRSLRSPQRSPMFHRVDQLHLLAVIDVQIAQSYAGDPSAHISRHRHAAQTNRCGPADAERICPDPNLTGPCVSEACGDPGAERVLC